MNNSNPSPFHDFPYLVTMLKNKRRSIRFPCRTIEEALLWLNWMERNEPELEPAIQLKAHYLPKPKSEGKSRKKRSKKRNYQQ